MVRSPWLDRRQCPLEKTVEIYVDLDGVQVCMCLVVRVTEGQLLLCVYASSKDACWLTAGYTFTYGWSLTRRANLGKAPS